MNNPKHIKI